jgi:hypothetical protein
MCDVRRGAARRKKKEQSQSRDGRGRRRRGSTAEQEMSAKVGGRSCRGSASRRRGLMEATVDLARAVTEGRRSRHGRDAALRSGRDYVLQVGPNKKLVKLARYKSVLIGLIYLLK